MAVERIISVPETTPRSPILPGELLQTEPISNQDMERTFRFWQKRLWLTSGLRRETRGQGFLKNFEKGWKTPTGQIDVRYTRNTYSEVLAITNNRLVSELELNEIREAYGEKMPVNDFIIHVLKRKRRDETVKSARVRHFIQLAFSPELGNSSYLAIEQFIRRKGHEIIDHKFIQTEKVDDPQSLKFIGWLAVQLI